MLELSGVHKSYRIGSQSLHVLRGVDLRVDTGESIKVR